MTEKKLLDSPRESGDMYFLLSPQGKVKMASKDDSIYDNLAEFINDCAYYTFRDNKPPYSNDFILHYRLDDTVRSNQIISSERGDIKPEKVYRLFPALYCFENNLAISSLDKPEEIWLENKKYQMAALRYSKMGERGITYHGIETDKGLLLFDGTAEGEALQEKYIDFYIHNFFDPRLDISFLKKVDLIPDELQKEKVNPSLDTLTSNSFGTITDSDYVDAKDIPVYCLEEQYDMRPTGRNFLTLLEIDKGRVTHLPAETYDISALYWLSDSACKSPDIDEYPNIFSYQDRFDPLLDRFYAVVNEIEEEKIMIEVRSLAKQLLNDEFSDIRKPKENFNQNRITEISLYSVNDGNMAIRCKIDGEQQCSRILDDRDTKMLNFETDKEYLAAKYFKEELESDNEIKTLLKR